MISPQFDPSETSATLLEKASALARMNLNEALECTHAALALAEKEDNSGQIPPILAFRSQLYAQLHLLQEGTADAERALQGFSEQGNDRGRAGVLNTLAIIKEHSGEYAESFSLQIECLQLLRRFDAPEALAQVTSNLGLTCTYIGDWTQALEFYKESLEEWDKLPEQMGKGLLLVNLGFAHASLKHFDAAESYYMEALKSFGDDASHTCLVYTNLARVFLKRGDLEKAGFHARRAFELSEKQEDPAKHAHALECFGSVQAAIGETEKARESFDQALEIYTGIPIPRGQAIVLRQLAKLAVNDPKNAETLLHEAREMALKSGLKPILIDILGDFNRIHKQQGNWQEAYRFLEEKVEAEKAVNSEIFQLKLETFQMDLRLRQSQRETELERLRFTELSDTLKDLEEQKQRAEEENRQKSEILHFAAHDLRNLLNNIIVPAELIHTDLSESKELPHISELVDIMSSAADKLEETFMLFLKAAAAESGQVELERQKVDMGILLKKVVSSWKNDAARKGQIIELYPGETPLQVSIDRNRMEDVLDNLISNALKYAPPATVIRVGIEKHLEGFCLFVADEGPGLTDEDKQLVGRLFQKLSAQPTGNETSIGVGLAVVKRYTELHGGRLEIECPAAGGSIFRIILPVTG